LASMLFLTIFDFFLVVSPEIEPIVQDIWRYLSLGTMGFWRDCSISLVFSSLSLYLFCFVSLCLGFRFRRLGHFLHRARWICFGYWMNRVSILMLVVHWLLNGYRFLIYCWSRIGCEWMVAVFNSRFLISDDSMVVCSCYSWIFGSFSQF
jgi:hypothetical protein